MVAVAHHQMSEGSARSAAVVGRDLKKKQGNGASQSLSAVGSEEGKVEGKWRWKSLMKRK